MKASGIGHNEPGPSGFQSDPDVPRRAHLLRLEVLAERNRRNLEESERARFWFATKVAATCAFGCLTGLLSMAWAMHTTDEVAGGLAWSIGPVVGQIIVVLALLIGWIRWQREEW